MTIKRLLSILVCGLFALATTSQLHADLEVPITGSASFIGTATASGASGPGLTTTITFGTNWNFLTGTGLYAGIPQTPAVFHSFSFTGDGTAAALSNTVPPLWSFTSGGNTYSFNLLSLTDGHTQNGAMAFTGAGTLFATGFDPTPASVGMTGSGNNFVFTLSFVTNSAVPEPSSIILTGFGVALCGAFVYLRRRRG